MCISSILSWLSVTANASLVIAIASPIIAACALVATIYNVKATRKHNRLSVKPGLSVRQSYSQAEGFSVEIVNNGVGPAVIKELYVFIDDDKVDVSNIKDMGRVLLKLFPTHGTKPSSVQIVRNTPFILPISKEIVLFNGMFEKSRPSDEEFYVANKKLKIIIKYESIYDEKHEYDSSSYSTGL